MRFGRYFHQRLLIYNAKCLTNSVPKRDFSRSIELTYSIYHRFLCGNLFERTFFSHILWENYTGSDLEWLKHVFSVGDFFSSKNVWDGVITYLWEREFLTTLITTGVSAA